jgi:hypothetical protein
MIKLSFSYYMIYNAGQDWFIAAILARQKELLEVEGDPECRGGWWGGCGRG